MKSLAEEAPEWLCYMIKNDEWMGILHLQVATWHFMIKLDIMPGSVAGEQAVECWQRCSQIITMCMCGSILPFHYIVILNWIGNSFIPKQQFYTK